MIVEVGKCDRKYAMDTANVILCDLKLEADPYFKVRNQRLRWKIYLGICLAFFGLSLALTLYYRNVVLGICVAVFVFCAMRAYAYLYTTGRLMKRIMSDDHHNTYTFSEEGVDCDTNDLQKVSFHWEYFRYIKAYDSGLYFIPKKKANSILAIPIQYEEELRAFLTERGIGLDIYR